VNRDVLLGHNRSMPWHGGQRQLVSRHAVKSLLARHEEPTAYAAVCDRKLRALDASGVAVATEGGRGGRVPPGHLRVQWIGWALLRCAGCGEQWIPGMQVRQYVPTPTSSQGRPRSRKASVTLARAAHDGGVNTAQDWMHERGKAR
jgi:hypothetical protein